MSTPKTFLTASVFALAVTTQSALHGNRVGIERDIRYGQRAREVLDLQWPSKSGFPSVLYVHEGSLTSGDKSDPPYAEICATFVARGVACAATNYTLLKDDGKWPQPAEDVAEAFAWMKKHIRARGGDSTRIYILGHSSGCHLAALVGTDPKYLAKHGLEPRDVSGVIALGCRLNNEVDSATAHPRLIRAYSDAFGSVAAANDAVPLAHVHSAMTPFLVMMGDAEQVNPPILDDAQRFAARAKAVGVDVPIEVLPDRKHMTAMRGLARADDIAFVRVMRFILEGR